MAASKLHKLKFGSLKKLARLYTYLHTFFNHRKIIKKQHEELLKPFDVRLQSFYVDKYSGLQAQLEGPGCRIFIEAMVQAFLKLLQI